MQMSKSEPEFETVSETSADNAVLLLAAAEELGLPASVVRTTREGFVVPSEVHEKAFGEKKSPAKKATAKKAASKSETK
jgi:hypothetical protein